MSAADRRPPAAALALAIASVAALAALTATGCGGGDDSYAIATVFDPCEPVVVVPDEGTPAAERRGTVAGVAMWNALAGAHYVVDGEPNDEDPAAVANAPRIPLHFDPAGGNFHGFYDDKRAEIFINTDLTGERLAITIAHEVGHTAGLLHVPKDERKSVMNSGNLVVTPTSGDRRELESMWGNCSSDPAAAAADAETAGAPPK